MRETETGEWAIPRATGSVYATVSLPGSKSLAARELLLAAISEQNSRIGGLPRSGDTDLMVRGLQALGAEITPWPPEPGEPVRICPLLNRTPKTPVDVECGLAGTVMRFLPALAVAVGARVRFRAQKNADSRPMLPLLEALGSLGASWEGEKPQRGIFPFTISAPIGNFPTTITVDAEMSSQFVSALLLAAPLWATRAGRVFSIRTKSRMVPSWPHVQMTLEAMSRHGIEATCARQPDGAWVWQVAPGAVISRDSNIEPDLTNAGTFLAAAGIAGGMVSIPAWPDHTTQVGDRWRQILAQFGMKVAYRHGVLSARGRGMLLPVTLDCADCGELVPTIAALAAYAGGVSHLEGLHHLRGHETDRLAAIDRELNRVGVKCEITPDDGLTITGIPKTMLPAKATKPASMPALMRAYGDPRMVMFAALLGMYRTVQIDEVGAVAKTLPDFPAQWNHLLGATQECDNTKPETTKTNLIKEPRD